ncbi:MAG: protein kinase [Legionella sp.]|uniref:protein kinase domain-containing protein n=1 Tax=Legionella sp. TaxID=459 RepID=UPI00283FCE1E|nr:protein kinase [Legionella sp.]
MPQIISPKTISSQNISKLYEFFSFQHKKNIHAWSKGVTYTLADGSNFEFSSCVIMRPRKEGKTGVRYEFVSDRILGQGTFGTIYEIECTVALSQDSYRLKEQGYNGKTRAIKRQYHDSAYSEDNAWMEYYSSIKATHLTIKKPVFINGPNYSISYMVMNKLRGRALSDIIKDDLSGHHILTLEQRIDLSKGLLRTLKEQVTDKGIIHCDIKPANILVDISTNPITINIIDFAYSTTADQPDNSFAGTPFYHAPEIWDKLPTTSVKIDVFSMARVIAELWHDKTLGTALALNSVEYVKNNAHNVNLNTLFSGIVGLDNENKSLIKITLAGMFRADSKLRLSIDEAIECLSQVNLPPPTVDAYRLEAPESNSTMLAGTYPEPTLSNRFLFFKEPKTISLQRPQADSYDPTRSFPIMEASREQPKTFSLQQPQADSYDPTRSFPIMEASREEPKTFSLQQPQADSYDPTRSFPIMEYPRKL